jgi:hypothetical protein
MYEVFSEKRPIFDIFKSAEVVEAVRLGGTPHLTGKYNNYVLPKLLKFYVLVFVFIIFFISV